MIRNRFRLKPSDFAALLLVFLFSGCATVVQKPCLTGGEPALGPEEKPIGGSRQCEQAKDNTGRFVNHGEYLEWYPDGRRAIEGEYYYGVKQGKWTRWDASGHVVSERFYNRGVELTLDPAKQIQSAPATGSTGTAPVAPAVQPPKR